MEADEEVMSMGYRDLIGVIQAIRSLNKALNDPEALDKELYDMQRAMEKGATEQLQTHGNA